MTVSKVLSILSVLFVVFTLMVFCNKVKDIPNLKLVITSLSPSNGPSGTIVRVSGSGFSAFGKFDSVYLNGKQVVFSDVSDTAFTLEVPKLAGSGNVEIQVNGERWIGPAFLFDTTIFVTTVAGSKTPGYADGTGLNARFQNPRAIAVDRSGNLYVADAYAKSIRKITPGGVVSTFAVSNGT